jgi:hypothetical protein
LKAHANATILGNPQKPPTTTPFQGTRRRRRRRSQTSRRAFRVRRLLRVEIFDGFAGVIKQPSISTSSEQQRANVVSQDMNM